LFRRETGDLPLLLQEERVGVRRSLREARHRPEKLFALALLTFPSQRDGPLPLLLKEERKSEPHRRLRVFKLTQ
jgi:hypothetical protein